MQEIVPTLSFPPFTGKVFEIPAFLALFIIPTQAVKFFFE